MRLWFNMKWAPLAILLIAIAGCGPSTSNLGRVLYEVPAVAGADQPYQFPDTVKARPDTKAKEGRESNSQDHIPQK